MEQTKLSRRKILSVVKALLAAYGVTAVLLLILALILIPAMVLIPTLILVPALILVFIAVFILALRLASTSLPATLVFGLS